MKCGLCGQSAKALALVAFYTREGIMTCEGCRKLVMVNKSEPYSKVMEKLAMTEAGYYVNRKLAKLRR